MNPDVFITIAFSGLALLIALTPLTFVVSRVRRENARTRAYEERKPPRA